MAIEGARRSTCSAARCASRAGRASTTLAARAAGSEECVRPGVAAVTTDTGSVGCSSRATGAAFTAEAVVQPAVAAVTAAAAVKSGTTGAAVTEVEGATAVAAASGVPAASVAEVKV